MLAYKGFETGLVCRGYQFQMGLNVTEKANCAANGFHCAEDPLDCLRYYPNMEKSEYYIVDAGGDVDEDNLDSKIACTELTILKKLDRRNFFLHALAYMADHPARNQHHLVCRDKGIANQSGFIVVRGPEPLARGKKGSLLALAKEDPQTGRIIQIGLTEVDGKRVRSGKWYNIDFVETKGV